MQGSAINIILYKFQNIKTGFVTSCIILCSTTPYFLLHLLPPSLPTSSWPHQCTPCTQSLPVVQLALCFGSNIFVSIWLQYLLCCSAALLNSILGFSLDNYYYYYIHWTATCIIIVITFIRFVTFIHLFIHGIVFI